MDKQPKPQELSYKEIMDLARALASNVQPNFYTFDNQALINFVREAVKKSRREKQWQD